MELNALMVRILQMLLDSNGKVLIETLLGKLDISRRILLYNVKKINYIFESNELPDVSMAEKYLSYDVESRDEIVDKILLNGEIQQFYIYSKEERQTLIFLYVGLVNTVVTLNKLVDFIDVSKNTIISDISSLKEELAEKGINLRSRSKTGYYLEGNELMIRCELYNCILRIRREPSGVAIQKCLREILHSTVIDGEGGNKHQGQIIYEVIQRAEYLKNYEINHNSIVELRDYLLMIHCRTRMGWICEDDICPPNTSEYDAAGMLIKELSQHNIVLPAEEQNYIAMILLGLRRGNYHEVDGRSTVDFRHMALDMIEAFENYACVRFENKPELVEQLVIHIRPMYYRLVYQVKVDSRYYKEILEESKDYWRVTRLMADSIEDKYHIFIPDEELAYLCIYFVSWLTRQKMGNDKGKERILVICGMGIGTSLFVKLQLENIIGHTCVIDTKDVNGLTVSDLMNYQLVLTTLKLPFEADNVIEVSPRLSERDKSLILNSVFYNGSEAEREDGLDDLIGIIENYALVEDDRLLRNALSNYMQMSRNMEGQLTEMHLKFVLTGEMMQVCRETVSDREAIRMSVLPLCRAGVVKAAYGDSIWQIIEERGLYFEIIPGILLAHAKPDREVKRVGLALTVFNEPVLFSCKKESAIRAVFVLCTPNNDAHVLVLKELLEQLRRDSVIDALTGREFTQTDELYDAFYSN